ncbi:HAMP domain-containing sensor histidine kinase [soil metagenome]
MFSSPADTAGVYTRGYSLLRPAAWSLRTRLVTTVAVLLAVLSLAIGSGTVLAMRHFLTGQLDDQLRDAGSRSLMFFNIGPPPFIRFPGPGPIFLDAPGQSTGTIGAVVAGGRVADAAVIMTTGDRLALNHEAAQQLAKLPSQRPVSVHLEGQGDYRVVSEPAENGQQVVTGLPTSGIHYTLISVIAVLGVLTAIGLVLAVVVGVIIVRRQLRPLSIMASTARDVAQLELERREVLLPTPVVHVDPAAERTEVGQLAGALTMMVDRMAGALAARHASESRVRQFVADASHELRTPLTSIRGYTEFAQKLSAGGHADLPYVLGRVASEAIRMTGLVEDMLLLARLDEGRPLGTEELDLSELILDAVSDAQIAAPDHRWFLDLPDTPVLLSGDRERIHQVLANLLSNASVHTPPGTEVISRLAWTIDRGAVIQVVDNGPGIPPESKSEIFQRFVRGDSSRSRRAGGTGLGLAIASAVVRAHGGTIEVDSVPGRTTFTVELPPTTTQSTHRPACPGPLTAGHRSGATRTA